MPLRRMEVHLAQGVPFPMSAGDHGHQRASTRYLPFHCGDSQQLSGSIDIQSVVPIDSANWHVDVIFDGESDRIHLTGTGICAERRSHASESDDSVTTLRSSRSLRGSRWTRARSARVQLAIRCGNPDAVGRGFPPPQQCFVEGVVDPLPEHFEAEPDG